MAGLRSPRHILLILLLMAAAIPYFVNLGVSSIWDANEAFYAQTPREMMEAGDYVTPSFNFQLRMNKPVLSYWNVAASYRLFGVSEWSERLPIAIGGLAIIATAFGLGRLLGGTTAGLLSALVLATSPRLLLLARRIIIDIHITMWMGLVLLFFALSEVRPQRRRLYLSLMYVAAGFGVLTKGPVAVFIPAVVFFIHLASQKRLRDLRDMMLPAGALISLTIVVPWYYLLYREHGWEYIGAFIFGENLGRYAEAVGEQSRGLLFYLPVMLADLFPWSLLIPVALWWAVRQPPQDRVTRLLVVWISTIVAFFSLSGTKEDLYILPIVAAEAALIGAMLAAAVEGAPARRPAAWFTGATAALLLAAGVVTFWLFAVTHRYSLDGAAFVGLTAVFGGFGALALALRRLVFAAAATLASAAVVIDLVCRALHAARLRALQTCPAVRRYHQIARQHRRHRRVVQIRASEHGLLSSPSDHGGDPSGSSARGVLLEQRHLLRDAGIGIRDGQGSPASENLRAGASADVRSQAEELLRRIRAPSVRAGLQP